MLGRRVRRRFSLQTRFIFSNSQELWTFGTCIICLYLSFFKRFELEIASNLGVTHQDVYSDRESFTYEVIEGGSHRVCVVQFNSWIMLWHVVVKCLKHWGYFVDMLCEYLLWKMSQSCLFSIFWKDWQKMQRKIVFYVIM